MCSSPTTLEKTPAKADRRLLRFNVGGQSFVTRASTIRSHPECLLARMLDGKTKSVLTDDDGSFFVDRDGSRFGFILDYMRGTKDSAGRVLLPSSLDDLEGLYDDAVYYDLPDLVHVVFDRIKTKLREDKRRRKRCTKTKGTLRCRNKRVPARRRDCCRCPDDNDGGVSVIGLLACIVTLSLL
ncbi:BTB domain protein [Mollivirus kamchatka]|nr:BTB domain protein [Mollivirus kamchatka]